MRFGMSVDFFFWKDGCAGKFSQALVACMQGFLRKHVVGCCIAEGLWQKNCDPTFAPSFSG